MSGSCGSAISSVAEAVIILSSATCALVACSGEAVLCWVPTYVVGKQFAEAPESSAAWIVVGGAASAKVTRFVVFTCSAFLVFKIDFVGVRDDRDEVELAVSAVVIVCVL